MSLRLVIGDKNYSTWSMRPWLLLKHFGVPFEEVQEHLSPPEDLSERLRRHSPSACVPVLIDDALVVWDSLAICEHVSETHLNGKGWPQDAEKRATARAVVAELHSGLHRMRREMPMNIRARRRVEISARARDNIARVDEIWARYPGENSGTWLFGDFSIADCFFAPVAMRFLTYEGVELSDKAAAYMSRLEKLPAVVEWMSAARAETHIVPAGEVGEEL